MLPDCSHFGQGLHAVHCGSHYLEYERQVWNYLQSSATKKYGKQPCSTEGGSDVWDSPTQCGAAMKYFRLTGSAMAPAIHMPEWPVLNDAFLRSETLVKYWPKEVPVFEQFVGQGFKPLRATDVNTIGCDLFLSEEAYAGIKKYLGGCEVRSATFEDKAHYLVSPPVGDFLDSSASQWKQVNDFGDINIYAWIFDEAKTGELHVIRQRSCDYIFVSEPVVEEMVLLKKKRKILGFLLRESHWDRSPIKG